MLQSILISTLAPEFDFAGFTFPRYVARLDSRPIAQRLESRRRVFCGEYFHAPKPITRGAHPGRGFYLDQLAANGLRFEWCDCVPGSNIRHSGWYCNDSGDKIAGIVARLPRGRGFLAGWSVGEGRASELDGCIYADAIDAARAADGMAERAAENQREYEAEQNAEQDGDQ